MKIKLKLITFFDMTDIVDSEQWVVIGKLELPFLECYYDIISYQSNNSYNIRLQLSDCTHSYSKEWIYLNKPTPEQITSDIEDWLTKEMEQYFEI